MTQQRPTRYRISLGKWGEEYARKYLETKGLHFISKNVRSPHGEIDLIMKDGETIVFIEVKTRASTTNGYPEEAITESKINHLDNCINWYQEKNNVIGDNWRVDVVSIIGQPEAKKLPVIDWWQNEF